MSTGLLNPPLDRSTPPPVENPYRAPAILAASGAVVAAVLFWVVSGSLTDDAYISLSAARNLAVHGEWAIVHGLTANTSTSPLNVLVLGALTFLTRLWGPGDPLLALGMLNVAVTALLGWVLARIGRRLGLGTFWAALAGALVVFNPFVLSAVGLEVLLIPAAVAVMVWFALDGRAAWFGAAAGMAALVRLDLLVFVLVIAALSPAIRGQVRRALGGFAAIAGPWYLFSWLVLGSALPDTFLIKQGQASDVGGYNYLTGPIMYFESNPWRTVAAFGPAALGLVLLLLALFSYARYRTRPLSVPGAVLALGLSGALYYVAYVVLDTVPYHWYYVAPATTLAMFAVLAAGIHWTAARNTTDRAAVGALAGLLAVLGAGAVYFDVEGGLPWEAPPIFGNWASAQDYERVGRAVGTLVGDAPVRSPGEIGTLAYFCECVIVDEFSDRGLVVEDRLVPRLAEASEPARTLLRANYAFFDYRLAPVNPAFDLRYGEGRGPGGPMSWEVFSAARGVGHFTLVPLAG
ncbi:membrane protein [Rhodococcus opacus]|uniref:membrane protein n=1 Tax=Rhodococcus opacus TaxID=37919 RepID=UPI0005C23C39|nr:membrane protein [Rhodococcus opacus]